ncbi:hypothetical protein, partial [Microcystis aeruginosa]|uniref:hypothetical protein n=1 Tax=Microcystis aeruginosa TaxID=1126 RepID=UPI001C10D198
GRFFKLEESSPILATWPRKNVPSFSSVFFQSIIDYQLISDRSSRGRGQRSKGDRGQWIIGN